MSSLRSASVREQLAASGAAAITVTPSPGPGASKSLFGRLGIRKPSILSLTSPHASGYVPATARTFSLDDLLKPPLRRKAKCLWNVIDTYVLTITHNLSSLCLYMSFSSHSLSPFTLYTLLRVAGRLHPLTLYFVALAAIVQRHI